MQSEHYGSVCAVKSSGTIDITPGDVTVGAAVEVSSPGGTAHVTAAGVHANFGEQSRSIVFRRFAVTVFLAGSFKVKFHGGASWLYNILSSLLKGTLRKAIAKAVDGALTNAINNKANQILARLPAQMHLGGGNSSTTYELAVSEFAVRGAGGAATAILGMASKAHNARNDALCPIAAPAMPAIVTPAHYMLQAQLSPALLSCAVWTAYQNRALDAYYTKAARGAFPLPLTTKGWSLFVPALAQKYPADLPMDARITFASGSPPQLVASPAGGLVLHNLSTVFNFGAMQQQAGAAGFLRGGGLQASTPVFSLGVIFDVGFKVTSVNERNTQTGHMGPVLKFAVTALSAKFTVLRSSIGSFQLESLQGLTDLLLPFMKTSINYFGGMGFPLPALGGMAFSTPAVVFQNNALAINTNITFSM